MCTDPKIQMFIATRCRTCTDLDCAGALNHTARDKCPLYDSWCKLSETEKAKCFMSAAADETLFIESLLTEEKK